MLPGDPAGALELAVDQLVHRLRPVLRLRPAGLSAGGLARPEGPLSGRSGLPGPVRGQAADAVAAPGGPPAGRVEPDRPALLTKDPGGRPARKTRRGKTNCRSDALLSSVKKVETPTGVCWKGSSRCRG